MWTAETPRYTNSVETVKLRDSVVHQSTKLQQESIEQGVHGLQAFVFCVVTVNDEHMKPRFKRKRRG